MSRLIRMVVPWTAALIVALAGAPARAQDSTAVAAPEAPPAGAAPTSAAPSMFSNLANPAIGMNALFSGQAARNLDRPYGLQFDEAEMSLISVVDPYWTFNGNIVFTDSGVDPEEIWVRNTSLSALQLKLGKLRGTFGKQGQLHPHAFPFVQPPIVMANTIGEEGFKAAGIEASWLTPLPWYAELTGGAYQAQPVDADHPLDLGSHSHANLPLLGHLKNLVDLDDATTLELGQSILQGQGADGRVHAAYGADLTVRHVPLRRSNQRGWTAQAEYLQQGAWQGGGYARGADGGYASLQYRLGQRWWTGVRGERARKSFTDFVVDAAGDPLAATIDRGSINLAWVPSEFSFLRLEYSHAKADAGIHRADNRILVQMSYTIGYHPAHAY